MEKSERKNEARKRLLSEIEQIGVSNVARSINSSESKIQAWKKRVKPSFPKLDTLVELDSALNVDWNHIIKGSPLIEGSSIKDHTTEELLSEIESLRKQTRDAEASLKMAQLLLRDRLTEEERLVVGFNDRVSSARSECKIIPFNPDYSSMKTA
jgi:hypothetical protein